MSYGWLTRIRNIVRDESWFGVDMDPTLDTRWEEYTLAAECLKKDEPGIVLDAGCGFEPRVHVMPEIAAELGWRVEAIDLLQGKSWEHLFHLWDTFEPHPRIRRRVMDMCDTDYPDAHFDAYLNISTLEHVARSERRRALNEAHRVLKPGGRIVVTMDGCWPIADERFDFGEPYIPPTPLSNAAGVPVCYMEGRKQ